MSGYLRAIALNSGKHLVLPRKPTPRLESAHLARCRLGCVCQVSRPVNVANETDPLPGSHRITCKRGRIQCWCGGQSLGKAEEQDEVEEHFLLFTLLVQKSSCQIKSRHIISLTPRSSILGFFDSTRVDRPGAIA